MKSEHNILAFLVGKANKEQVLIQQTLCRCNQFKAAQSLMVAWRLVTPKSCINMFCVILSFSKKEAMGKGCGIWSLGWRESKNWFWLLNQVLKGKKIKGLVLKTYPQLSVLCQCFLKTCQFFWNFSNAQNGKGTLMSKTRGGRLVDFKIIQAPGVRG